jgi:hypothetical protein
MVGSPGENTDTSFIQSLNNDLDEEDEKKDGKLVDEKELFKGI